MKIVYDAAEKRLLFVYAAQRCRKPERCAERGTQAEKRATATGLLDLPLRLEARGADGSVFRVELPPCPAPRCARSRGGRCTGGVDSFRGEAGIVRVQYGRDGSANVTARLFARAEKLPSVAAPVRVVLEARENGNGRPYRAEATFRGCRRRVEEKGAVVVCR